MQQMNDGYGHRSLAEDGSWQPETEWEIIARGLDYEGSGQKKMELGEGFIKTGDMVKITGFSTA